jgi:pSer/pThr/pTyr-binding forkhead associated (FHA) protein
MEVTLSVVRGQPQGKCLPVPRGEFVFGHGPECHIRSNSAWVNRQHCLLRVAGDGVHLRDLGSSTGTLVNGVRLIGEQRLAHGDEVQMGPLVLQVLLCRSTAGEEPGASATAASSGG